MNSDSKISSQSCGCGENIRIGQDQKYEPSPGPDIDLLVSSGSSSSRHLPSSECSQILAKTLNIPTAWAKESRVLENRARPSVSDTVILAKGSRHAKAMSTSRLTTMSVPRDGSDTSSQCNEVLTPASSSCTSIQDDPDQSCELSYKFSSSEEISVKSQILKDCFKDEQVMGVAAPKESETLRKRKSRKGSPSPRSSKNSVNADARKVVEDLKEIPEKVLEDASFDVQQKRRESNVYYVWLMVLTTISFLTRMYNIEIPAHICWDETHFGKMGSWYINRTFFFDVHPPLGKMLIGLAGVLTGYNGSFPFNKPGDAYGDVQYVGMRMFCAMLGSFLPSLVYQCVYLLTNSVVAAIFAGAFVVFDTGTLTLSRYILLDPILMFFIMTSTYSCLKFLTNRNSPFSFWWWTWVMLVGISLAGAIGVKFVGLFVILLVGYTTAMDLWRLLGDLSLSLLMIFKHVVARVACLICLPVCVYMAIFAVHFMVLNHSGNGDGFFSSAFQSQLIGNRLYNVSMPQYVAFGSVITLKQRRTGGAYLHSHSHLYPEDLPPRQQQVTTYSHKDENNNWKIKPADRELGSNEDVVFVYHGDLVRLEHVATRRNLHSHREMAPVSKHHYQVSGYGQNGTGDANDIWLVEIEGGNRGDRLQTVRSKIKFIHYHVRCLLHSHDRKLPKWGWEQLEVTCQPNLRDKTSAWSVEEVIDSRLPSVSFEVYSPSLLERFLESHAVMTQGNSGLKPKEGEITSHPWHWPIDYKGQVFSGQDHRIYMLGNPIIFWWLLALKVLYVFVWVAISVIRKRKVPVSHDFKIYCDKTFKVCWWLLLAWGLHYLPFWTMTRVLYFHHYFPAFLFSAMFGGVFLDFLLTLVCLRVPENWARTVLSCCLMVTVGIILWSFYLFYPLVYGMAGPMANEEGSAMHRLKLLESWDF